MRLLFKCAYHPSYFRLVTDLFWTVSIFCFDQRMLSGSAALVLPRSLLLQQTLENEVCVVPSGSLFQIVCIGDQVV